MALQAN
ncbi:uncharacterized protein FFFS_15991 [Fusarium fujikuroi]|nr:uncharacterized protein FFFS_15991 [Fusarium fujikuroi]